MTPNAGWTKNTNRWASAVLCAALVAGAGPAAQVRPAESAASGLREAIDQLGVVDFATRTRAARVVRRTPPAQAVPALLQAVAEHADGFVRFRALVLLTGFDDPRVDDVMIEAMASPNDRLRTVAYGYAEQHPDARYTARLVAALDREEGEFVRPALVRALAARASDPAIATLLVRETGRGLDYFRSSVLEAVGDYKVRAAVTRLREIARLDGPLQDDAVMALGKIGDPASLETLAGLQRTAPDSVQPAVAAAICLLGINCPTHVGYLEKSLTFAAERPGYQDLLRNAASGLGAIAARGDGDVLRRLLDVGRRSEDPVRAPVTLAVGLVALRNPPLLLQTLEGDPDQDGAIGLLAEAFDMLEEDTAEEQFFAVVRRTYWAAAEGSATRAACERIIDRLDF